MKTLFITKKAWNLIETAVLANPRVETGGALMGYALDDQHWVVTFASGPGPNAYQERHAVMLDETYLRRLIRFLRIRSGGRWTYIGDWHSHTTRRLTPSRADRSTLVEKSLLKSYGTLSPIMLIAGPGSRMNVSARAFILTDSLEPFHSVQLIERPVSPQSFRTSL